MKKASPMVALASAAMMVFNSAYAQKSPDKSDGTLTAIITLGTASTSANNSQVSAVASIPSLRDAKACEVAINNYISRLNLVPVVAGSVVAQCIDQSGGVIEEGSCVTRRSIISALSETCLPQMLP